MSDALQAIPEMLVAIDRLHDRLRELAESVTHTASCLAVSGADCERQKPQLDAQEATWRCLTVETNTVVTLKKQLEPVTKWPPNIVHVARGAVERVEQLEARKAATHAQLTECRRLFFARRADSVARQRVALCDLCGEQQRGTLPATRTCSHRLCNQCISETIRLPIVHALEHGHFTFGKCPCCAQELEELDLRRLVSEDFVVGIMMRTPVSSGGSDLPPGTQGAEFDECEGNAMCLMDEDHPARIPVECERRCTMCPRCILSIFREAVVNVTTARCPICKEVLSSENAARFLQGHELDTYCAVELRATLGVFLSCPTPLCMNVVELGDGMRHEHFLFNCSSCSQSSCTMCREQPYHVGLSCAEARQVRAQWLVLAGQLGGLPPDFLADQRARLAAYETLRADEEYKRSSCKLCPHCGRVVEWIADCGRMQCGLDYHGGNIQNGCGKKFHWTADRTRDFDFPKALPYIAQLPPPPAVASVTSLLEGNFNHGDFHKCKGCNKPIVGALFHCANCVDFEMCLPCLQRTLKDKRHPTDHYFLVHKTTQ